MPVSGETLDLVDIKVTGYTPFNPDLEEPNGAYGEVNLQTLTDRGVTDANYFWYDFTEYNWDDEGHDRVWYGWYADGEESAAQRGDFTFTPGEGFLVICESYDFPFALQSSGQVLTVADQPVDLRLHNKVINNPTPVTVYLQQCRVEGYPKFNPDSEDPTGAYGEVNAQKLSDLGFTDASYFWYDFIEYDYDGDGNDRTWYGWYYEGEEEQEPITPTMCPIEAGEGLLVICETFDFDYTFVWPKVDVK